jgi:2-dehydropantoate 2-reductase
VSGRQRVLLVGPGALGIVTAVRLARAGHEVIVAARTPESAAQLRARGFRVDGGTGERQEAALEVVSAPSSLTSPVDVLIVATKAAVSGAAARTWLPALAASGTFVPYQNGLLGDEIAQIAGERLVECAVYYGATLVEPGHSRLTGSPEGHLHLGPWPRGAVAPGGRTARVAELLSAVVPTYVYDDVYSVKWNKLVANSAMTSLGVISGLGMAGMMQHGAIRRAFLEVAKESLTIAEAAGARPMSLGGFDAKRITRLPRFLASLGLRWKTRNYGAYKSSSQQSLDRGERTEVDYLNGRIVAEAKRLRMPAPWNAAVVAAVKEVEAAPASAGVARVEALVVSHRRTARRWIVSST